MSFITMSRHVIFPGSLSTNPAENEPFPVKIINWLIHFILELKVMLNLPHWGIFEGLLGKIAISKGNIFERHQPLIYVGSWGLIVPISFVVHRPVCFYLNILSLNVIEKDIIRFKRYVFFKILIKSLT